MATGTQTLCERPKVTTLREACAADAVILSPIESMVPVYYSKRHIIRVIENDDLLDEAIPQTAEAFPGSPLYLALQPNKMQLSHFPRALSRYVRKSTPDLILLDVQPSRAGHGDGKGKSDVHAERERILNGRNIVNTADFDGHA